MAAGKQSSDQHSLPSVTHHRRESSSNAAIDNTKSPEGRVLPATNKGSIDSQDLQHQGSRWTYSGRTVDVQWTYSGRTVDSRFLWGFLKLTKNLNIYYKYSLNQFSENPTKTDCPLYVHCTSTVRPLYVHCMSNEPSRVMLTSVAFLGRCRVGEPWAS